MSYWRFASYNVIGGIAWIAIFLLLGYFFGQIDFVKKNVEVLAIGIVLISVLPMVWEWWRARRAASTHQPGDAQSGS